MYLNGKINVKPLKKKDIERKVEEGSKHREEVEFLKKHNQSLKKELEQLLSIPNSANNNTTEGGGGGINAAANTQRKKMEKKVKKRKRMQIERRRKTNMLGKK